MSSFYNKIRDLAHMIGQYRGSWGPVKGITGNHSVLIELLDNYTLGEIEEATRLLERQIADSEI